MHDVFRVLLFAMSGAGLILVAASICLYARYLALFVGFWYAVFQASAADVE